MPATVRVVVDHGAVRRITHGRDGEVYGDMTRRGRNGESDAKRRCPVDMGRLRASIASVTSVESEVIVRVGSNSAYALYVHDGTGIYGPRGAPITPARAKYLSWQPRGGGRRVFVKSVKGMRGRPFLRDAVPAMGR